MTEPITARMISYAAPDGTKMEVVRVAFSGLALRATGYVVSTAEPAYGATYAIAVDAEGRTKRIAVRSEDASGERSLSLTRSPGGPWVVESVAGSTVRPELGDAVDVYVADSAFATSLPVRRLDLHREAGASAEITVASISLPDLTVTPVVHRGHTDSVSGGGARVKYVGAGADREVLVDADGLLVG